MLTGHLRGLLRLFTVLLIATALNACGGGGGSPGTTGPVTPTPITTGALNVTTSGLPAGVNASVRITGPNNYQQDLTQPQTISGLAPGSYTVAAAPVSANNVTTSQRRPRRPRASPPASPPTPRSPIPAPRWRSPPPKSSPASTTPAG